MTGYRLHYFRESGNSYKLALMLTLGEHQNNNARAAVCWLNSRSLPSGIDPRVKPGRDSRKKAP